MIVAAEFGTGQVLWSIFWFFLFVMWFSLVISIFGDIMRDRTSSGFAKALWALAIIAVPFLGVFMYLIVNGDRMNQRQEERIREQSAAMMSYQNPTSSQLANLNELHKSGALTDAEFQQAKARVVAG